MWIYPSTVRKEAIELQYILQLGNQSTLSAIIKIKQIQSKNLPSDRFIFSY